MDLAISPDMRSLEGVLELQYACTPDCEKDGICSPLFECPHPLTW